MFYVSPGLHAKTLNAVFGRLNILFRNTNYRCWSQPIIMNQISTIRTKLDKCFKIYLLNSLPGCFSIRSKLDKCFKIYLLNSLPGCFSIRTKLDKCFKIYLFNSLPGCFSIRTKLDKCFKIYQLNSLPGCFSINNKYDISFQVFLSSVNIIQGRLGVEKMYSTTT